MNRMHGICVPMITPMKEGGSVDYHSLENLTEHLISRGVDALYPCGTTGEVNNLSFEERKQITETVVKASAGRVPVFAQIGGRITSETLELARLAFRTGADGLGLLSPTYYHLTDEELLGYYKAVADAVPDTAIYIYGIPFCTGNALSTALVERIAEECPNILGIKYSVGDILQLSEFSRIRNGSFDVLVAPIQMLLPSLAIGVVGTVSGNNHIYIEAIAKLIHTFEAGDIRSCREQQTRLATLSGKLAYKEIAKCKALLARAGVIRSDTIRLPQLQVGTNEKEELFQFIDEYYPEYSFRL